LDSNLHGLGAAHKIRGENVSPSKFLPNRSNGRVQFVEDDQRIDFCVDSFAH
jgi:hypothetical protein